MLCNMSKSIVSSLLDTHTLCSLSFSLSLFTTGSRPAISTREYKLVFSYRGWGRSYVLSNTHEAREIQSDVQTPVDSSLL